DHDDVADHLDKCPNTPAGVSVDADGCPTVLTLHIKFDHDSNSVSSEYDGEIAKAAQCINDYPGNIVFIDGHTDNNGPATYNQKLSEHRSAAVKKRLVEKFNIPESRMASRGFGEDQPVADNNSDEGRGLNRRVEVACGAK
ncbi:MAG: OmpA family protein, partial [Desulfuromusa sp.]|nr:OmpA family protein [Desulfuromusa sp.]